MFGLIGRNKPQLKAGSQLQINFWGQHQLSSGIRYSRWCLFCGFAQKLKTDRLTDIPNYRHSHAKKSKPFKVIFFESSNTHRFSVLPLRRSNQGCGWQVPIYRRWGTTKTFVCHYFVQKKYKVFWQENVISFFQIVFLGCIRELGGKLLSFQGLAWGTYCII